MISYQNTVQGSAYDMEGIVSRGRGVPSFCMGARVPHNLVLVWGGIAEIDPFAGHPTVYIYLTAPEWSTAPTRIFSFDTTRLNAGEFDPAPSCSERGG